MKAREEDGGKISKASLSSIQIIARLLVWHYSDSPPSPLLWLSLSLSPSLCLSLSLAPSLPLSLSHAPSLPLSLSLTLAHTSEDCLSSQVQTTSLMITYPASLPSSGVYHWKPWDDNMNHMMRVYATFGNGSLHCFTIRKPSKRFIFVLWKWIPGLIISDNIVLSESSQCFLPKSQSFA